MTAYQQEQSIGTTNPQSWTTPTYTPQSFCFNPAGTEVWQVYFRNGGTGQVAPRVVQLTWPGLVEIDSFAFDWWQGGVGQTYYQTTNAGYHWGGAGMFIEPHGTDTLIVARSTYDTSTTGRGINFDTWQFGVSTVASTVTTLSAATASTSAGWNSRAFCWDHVRGKGLSLVQDRSTGTHSLFLISSSGHSLVTGGIDVINGFTPGFWPSIGYDEVHFYYRNTGDSSGSWRAAVYDMDAATLTTSATATPDWVAYPGLENVGTVPFGNGVHYYVYDPIGGTYDPGADINDIDAPGVGGTARTVDEMRSQIADGFRLRTNPAHTVGGGWNGGSGSTATHTWYEMYRVGTPDTPNLPFVGFIGIV